MLDATFMETVPKRNRNKSIVCIDPGETIGLCRITDCIIENVKQVKVKSVVDGAQAVIDYVSLMSPDWIICEDYKVYEWESSTHSWDRLHTPRLIGAIEFISAKYFTNEIKLILRMAHEAKKFSTDEKLKAWGLYKATKGVHHGRDALRHGVFSLIFD